MFRKSLFSIFVLVSITFIAQFTLAGQITITKSGNSFTSFMPGNEDYKPSTIYEEGILLGDGADNSNPIYEFILPPKIYSSENQIDYIQVRLVGDDYTNYSLADARIIIGADNFETSIQATQAWSWTDNVALSRLTNGEDESILEVTLIVNDGWAKFDLEKIEVTYGYSNVSSGILDTWQNLYTAKKSFAEFKDVTVPTWDAVSTSINYLIDGIAQCRSFANNVSNIGSGSLYNALTSANSAIDDLVEVEGTLSGSFNIIPWVTSYGVIEAAAGPGNYFPSGIIANFDDVLTNLNMLTDNYYLYAFDGEVNADDYNQHLETDLLGLRAGYGGMPSLKLGMNTAADIIKTLYSNQKTDISEAMFYSLAPMYTPLISESEVPSITPSYLQEFSNYIDTLILYSAVPVPEQPVLLFPADNAFAKGSAITLYWNESATATNYHLQISLNSSFSNIFYDSDVGDATSTELTGFPNNGLTKFYWRVKASNPTGWSLYSDYRVFSNGCLNSDFNSDCEVTIDDLAIFVSHWLDTECSSIDLCDGTDMVRSGDIDFEDFAAFATNWQKTAPEPPDSLEPAGMVWISISDPGFNGEISKYETTNAQYCEYLNAIYPSQINVINGIVYALNDIDKNEPYCEIYPEGSIYSLIEFSGETFSVRTRDNYSMANHPVVEISRYGAIAFCDFYEYRLPGIWEWQAVADFDGSYIYGCGSTIDQNMANYDYANPLGLSSFPYTSPVGYYPDNHGYKVCDMAGNVMEWTSYNYDPPSGGGPYSIFHGGSFSHISYYCEILYESNYSNVLADYPYKMFSDLGFRVCR